MGCTASFWMFSWPYGKKIIFLNFSGSGMQIKGGQNTVLTLVMVEPRIGDVGAG